MHAMNTDHTPEDLQRLRELAALLDCFLDEDLQALGRIKASTTESWRKRGEGPPYVLLGNRAIYPRSGVRTFIAEKLKDRRREVRSLL